MDDSNHELVNMLTNQMGNVLNPIVQESIETNKKFAETNRQIILQLTRLCNFLGAPPAVGRQVHQVRQPVHVQGDMGVVEEDIVYQGQAATPQRNVSIKQPRVLVQRHQEADQVLDQVRQDELAVENNLTNIVERIMARNGMNTMPRPTYSSPLSEYILQTENL